MTTSLRFEITKQHSIEVLARTAALDALQANALVAVIAPPYSAFVPSVGHTIYGVNRAQDVGSLLAVMIECDRALAGAGSVTEQDAALRCVLEAWFAAKDWCALDDEEVGRLRGAVGAYYGSVEPLEIHEQVPRLVLAWVLQHREDWAGAAECLQRAVDQLPRDDVLRFAATKRLVECLEALDRPQAARQAAREGLRAFQQLGALSEYGAVLEHWRELCNAMQDG